MMRFLPRLFVIGLLAPLAAMSVRAQNAAPDRSQSQAQRQDSASQSQNDDDSAPPYTPPAASKSVEVGNFYFVQKQYRGALSRYREAVQTDPYYAPAYLGLGRTYEKLGQKQKALTNYQKYLDLLPSEKQADEARKVHLAMGRLEKALKKPGRPRKPAPGPQAGNRSEPEARSQ